MMRFAILTDLHLGRSGEGHWHNKLLYDRAREITHTAVETLNRQQLDAVFILGDITEAGLPAQLELASDVLSKINAPWYVLPGNHDRAAVRSGLFDQVFTGHLIQPYSLWGDIGVIGIRERVPADRQDESTCLADAAWLAQSVEAANTDRSSILLIFSHFPLLDEKLWATEHGGKDAGHLSPDLSILAQLETAVRRDIAIFCGHEHWQHVMQDHNWLQCTTAALIEYPMEMRLASVDHDTLRIQTIGSGNDIIAAQSLETAHWVRGRAQDRTVEWAFQYH